MNRKLRFRGEYRNKVDAKGRVSIPAEFRRVLEAGDPDCVDNKSASLIILYGFSSKFLQCHTVQGIEEIEAKIETMTDPERRAIRNRMSKIYSQQVLLLNVDDTGRIVLPIWLRKKFGLEAESYFVSKMGVFEIWNPETYVAEGGEIFDADAAAPAAVDDDFDPEDILYSIDL